MITATSEGGTPNIIRVAIDQIYAARQDRQNFDNEAIEDLAHNIRVSRWCNPITVTPLAELIAQVDKDYLLVCGERRLRAQLRNGETHIDAVVAHLDLEGVLQLQWAENQSRRDLKPIEQARAIERRMTLLGWDVATVSRELAVPESTIRDRLALLRCISEVQDMLLYSDIPLSYALVLSRMSPAAQHEAVKLLARSLNSERFRAECSHIQACYDQMSLPGYDAFAAAYEAGINEWVTSQQQRQHQQAQVDDVYPAIEGLPDVPRAQTQTLSLALYIDHLASSGNPKLVEYSKLLGHVYNEWYRAGRIRRRPN